MKALLVQCKTSQYKTNQTTATTTTTTSITTSITTRGSCTELHVFGLGGQSLVPALKDHLLASVEGVEGRLYHFKDSAKSSPGPDVQGLRRRRRLHKRSIVELLLERL